MKKNILLTGSNGFLGQSFIDGFDKELYNIFALDFQKELPKDIHGVKDYFSIDISKPFQLAMDFDVIIHLAALNQTNINSDYAYEKFEAVNVIGTKNVINSCNFEKFIFFSTANLYEKTGSIIDEEAPIKPISFYERSKHEAELACKEYIQNEKLIILRPVNITGIKQENKAIVPFFFSKIVKNEPINIFVPKNKKIQLLSVKDILRALELIIKDEKACGVFNLSNKDSVEIRTLAERIIALCNSNSNISCTNDNIEDYSEISSDKAKQLLNWEAQDSIAEIIKDYTDFFICK